MSSNSDPASQSEGSVQPEQSLMENAPEAVVETIECANCGRVFTGNYCPACGQEADTSVSATAVIGGFFRELVDIENGF